MLQTQGRLLPPDRTCRDPLQTYSLFGFSKKRVSLEKVALLSETYHMENSPLTQFSFIIRLNNQPLAPVSLPLGPFISCLRFQIFLAIVKTPFRVSFPV